MRVRRRCHSLARSQPVRHILFLTRGLGRRRNDAVARRASLVWLALAGTCVWPGVTGRVFGEFAPHSGGCENKN